MSHAPRAWAALPAFIGLFTVSPSPLNKACVISLGATREGNCSFWTLLNCALLAKSCLVLQVSHILMSCKHKTIWRDSHSMHATWKCRQTGRITITSTLIFSFTSGAKREFSYYFWLCKAPTCVSLLDWSFLWLNTSKGKHEKRYFCTVIWVKWPA